MSARGGTKKDLLRTIRNLQAENLRYAEAIRWALGMEGTFRPREENDPPYWWRKELRERAIPPNDQAQRPALGGKEQHGE